MRSYGDRGVALLVRTRVSVYRHSGTVVGQDHLRDSQTQAEPLHVAVGDGEESHEGEDVPLRHRAPWNQLHVSPKWHFLIYIVDIVYYAEV